MMGAALRSAGAVAAGIAVAFVLVVAVEAFSAVVHPFPEDFGGTRAEVVRQVELYPAWVLAVVLPAWGFAAFAGAWTAGRLGSRGTAAFVGVLLLAALILNIAQLPYPIWFEVGSVLVIGAAVVYDDRLSGRRAATAVQMTA